MNSNSWWSCGIQCKWVIICVWAWAIDDNGNSKDKQC